MVTQQLCCQIINQARQQAVMRGMANEHPSTNQLLQFTVFPATCTAHSVNHAAEVAEKMQELRQAI
jgi:hypothetical protein